MYNVTGTFTRYGRGISDTADYQRPIPAGDTLGRAVAQVRNLYQLGKSVEPPARGVIVEGHGRAYEVYADAYFATRR